MLEQHRAAATGASENIVSDLDHHARRLVFERPANWFGASLTQTLEPRLFYVYVPYRNQDHIPLFDTTLADFNYPQLFTENRYLGSDRIGDASQLTLAVSTRLLDPVSGDERLRAAVGQRYYFQSQRVTLTEAPRTANSSDVLLTAESKLSDYWTAAGTYEVNVNRKETQELDLGLRWQPAPGKVLNASYRFNRQQADSTGNVTQLKQVDFSGTDNKRIDAVGGFCRRSHELFYVWN